MLTCKELSEGSLPAAAEKGATNQILQSELEDFHIRYVHAPEFDDRQAVHSILESLNEGSAIEELTDGLSMIDYTQCAPVSNIPILSTEQERILFLRMNCLRFLAARRRESAMTRIPTSVDLRTIKNLLGTASSIRDLIALTNQKLVMWIAGKHSSHTIEHADMISEANMSLLKAIDLFDISRGFRFSTYATHAVQRHLNRLVFRTQQILVAKATGDEYQPEAYAQDPEFVEIAPRELVRRLLENIPKRVREMILLRYGLNPGQENGMTYKEIAEIYGVSAERIRQLIRDGYEAIKNEHAISLGYE